MIIVRVLSGLGNQMFQYALGVALKKKYQTNVFLDNSFFRQNRFRKYGLDVFLPQLPLINAGSSPILYKKGFRIIGQWLLKERNKFPFINRIVPSLRYDFIYDQEQGFQPELFSLDLNREYYLDGWWGTEQYFLDYKDEIRKIFSFPSTYASSERFYLESLEKDKASQTISVAIHVRRGDYLTPFNRGVFCELPLKYYLTAMQVLRQKYLKVAFYIFSDDLPWCRQMFLHCHEKVVMVDLKQEAWRDMRLMTKCDCHIIANSTFSWWGAWLAESEQGMILAPGRWFKEGVKFVEKDIIPKRWTKIYF